MGEVSAVLKKQKLAKCQSDSHGKGSKLISFS